MLSFSSIRYDGFTPVHPFNRDNPLSQEVQSDHSEIGIKISDNTVINSWNISNPFFHKYFKFGSNPPFLNTFLYVAEPYPNDMMDINLKRKTEDQINTIANRFVKNEVNIQVIIEGFESFYLDLSEKILEMGHKEFMIISLLNDRPESLKANDNITGILVDTSRFALIKSGVINVKYTEIEDGGKEKVLNLPYVFLNNKATNSSFTVMGVHVNGCASQHPRSGLEAMAIKIDELYKETNENDIFAIGDFNAPPINIKESLARFLNSDYFLLTTDYLNHVNPSSNAAKYDHVLKKGKKLECDLLSIDVLSVASQALVKNVHNAIIP